MKSRDDIESYLMRMDLPHEEIGTDTWLVHTNNQAENIVVSLAGPVAVFRCKVMEIPDAQREGLFRTLLEFNVSDLLHGAYGIEGTSIVLSDALELENLDFNEFQATVEDISLAVANHYGKLAKFRPSA